MDERAAEGCVNFMYDKVARAMNASPKIFIATMENEKPIIKAATFSEVSKSSAIVELPNGDEIYFYQDFIDNLINSMFFWNNPELFFRRLKS